jgi:hypothetical protein
MPYTAPDAPTIGLLLVIRDKCNIAEPTPQRRYNNKNFLLPTFSSTRGAIVAKANMLKIKCNKPACKN